MKQTAPLNGGTLFPILTILWLALFSALAPVARGESPLALVFENQTFIYNQEHTGIDFINEGFTLTGNLTKTYFRYSLKPRLWVEMGALLQIPLGDDNRVDQVDPIISLHYGFAPGWLLTAGTIDRNHPLHDAFFNDNLRYLEPIEQGFQLKGYTQNILQDTWISWEERETATRREKFSVGNVTQLRTHGFMVEAQVYWVHLGGQKNSGPGVFNNLSLGLGTGYTYEAGSGGLLSFIDNIGFTVHYLYNKDDPPGLPVVDDEGISARVFTSVWDTYLYFLLWDGGSANFNSPRGDVTMPGVPLAKGDPFYKSDNFKEIGLVKTLELADGVTLTLDFRAQYILDKFVQIYHANFTWRDAFGLFEEYFEKRRARRAVP